MSFSIDKMHIPAPTDIFSFRQTLLAPLSSLAQIALNAISNIGALFANRNIFTQAEAAEIDRVGQSQRPCPEQNRLDSLTQTNTEKNMKIPLEEADNKTRKPFRGPKQISFNPETQVQAFSKYESPSSNPGPRSTQPIQLRSILKGSTFPG